MSAFPTGVAIVTTLEPDGTPRGLTTNAVSSVSAEPPILLVCVDRDSRTLPALLHTKRFVVNFMRDDHAGDLRAVRLEGRRQVLAGPVDAWSRRRPRAARRRRRTRASARRSRSSRSGITSSSPAWSRAVPRPIPGRCRSSGTERRSRAPRCRPKRHRDKGYGEGRGRRRAKRCPCAVSFSRRRRRPPACFSPLLPAPRPQALPPSRLRCERRGSTPGRLTGSRDRSRRVRSWPFSDARVSSPTAASVRKRGARSARWGTRCSVSVSSRSARSDGTSRRSSSGSFPSACHRRPSTGASRPATAIALRRFQSCCRPAARRHRRPAHLSRTGSAAGSVPAAAGAPHLSGSSTSSAPARASSRSRSTITSAHWLLAKGNGLRLTVTYRPGPAAAPAGRRHDTKRRSARP